MDQKERDEVYERIPWETLEKKSGDKNWIVYTVAGAIAVGALAYSFTRNQPALPPAADAPAVVSTAPATTMAAAPASPSTVASPIVVTEADLYAVDPERLIDSVATHAELFAVEYIATDPSSEELLTSLLPAGIPTPVAPEGVQVFVDWVGATSVTETGIGSYEVVVLVRSLSAEGGGGFVRQPVRKVTVPITIDENGTPLVSNAPSVSGFSFEQGPGPVLSELPAGVELADGVHAVGGVQVGDGSWQVVAMEVGPDGVSRPVLLEP